MKKVFTADQFTPTQWDTAEQKAKFANHFKRFLEADMPQTLFYDWFYKRLSMTFGHIAHYDRGGFYATFFQSLSDKVEFLKITLSSWLSGDPARTYSDVEQALREWLRESGLHQKYQQRLAEAVEALTGPSWQN